MSMVVPPGTNNPYDPQHPPRSAPWMGVPLHWSTADLETPYAESVRVLTQVSVTTLSTLYEPAGHGIKISVELQSPTVTCTLELQDASANVLYSWAVDKTNTTLHAGNLEFVELAGVPVKFKVVDPTNGWVSVNVQGVLKHAILSGAFTATTAAAALPSQPCKGVRVKNNGSEDLLIGGADGQSYVVSSGQSDFFDCNNAGDVWVKASATSVAVCWFARA